MTHTLILASGNAHKAAELTELFRGLDLKVVTMKQAGYDLEIIENGRTFEENALIKARAVYEASGRTADVLADDSGLEIRALGGEPGIRSARFLGEETDYPTKIGVLQEVLGQLSDEERAADFRCVLAAVLGGREVLAEGRVDGRIALASAGESGFGYDPCFYLPELGCTMAQLPPKQKNALSHRGRAAAALRPVLKAYLEQKNT